MSETIVQTVLGRVPSSELGITLPHEHLFATTATANLELPSDAYERGLCRRAVSLELRDWLEYHWHNNSDNLVLDDAETAFEELRRYQRAGGKCVVDVTSVGIGRQPVALASLSRKTGLHIVMGSGYYVATTHPAELAATDRDAITERIIGEFSEGVDDTGIRPGVIGEIGCSWPLTDVEEKVLAAAGIAQRRLGAGLYVHPGKHPDAPAQILKILQTAGADTSRVIICHIERTVQETDRIKDLLRSGCTVEYDLFGMETTGFYYRPLGIDMPSDAQRLQQLRQLIDAGFIRQVIISQDICFKHRLHRYGGHGYDHILRNILPWMRQRGFAEGEIETIVTENPQRLLALETKG
jgi:phosphotriesterase-related protein